MLKPELLRELTLAPNAHAQHKPWLSAASGLVCTGNMAYVVADDELNLGYFPCAQPWTRQQQHAPVELLPLFAGVLPVDEKQRKKSKPDLETLVLLPHSADFSHGALMTLGSGSKPNRCRALVLALQANGQPSGQRHEFDLSELYAPLHKHFADTNIEGVFINGSHLRLLHRGNKGHNDSACVSYDLMEFMEWALNRRSHPPKIDKLLSLDFGSVNGVPLCPTDAVALPAGGWVVSLVAEDSDNSYQDGACVGSALAVMDADDKLSQLQMLERSPKVEGLAVMVNGNNQGIELLMVTDGDDAALPALLLKVKVLTS